MAEVTINITDISGGLGDWTGSGTTPYINATDASYVTSSTKKGVTTYLKFENTAATGTISSVIIYVRALSSDGTGDLAPFTWSVDDGASDAGSTNILNFNTSYETRNSGELVATFDTWDKINAAAIKFQKDNSTVRVDVDHVYMTVVYTPAATQKSTGGTGNYEGAASRKLMAKRTEAITGDFSGAIARRAFFKRALAAGLDFAGTAAGSLGLIQKTVSGAIDYAGELLRIVRFKRAVDGNADFAGNISKINRTKKSATGEEIPAGVIARKATFYRTVGAL